MSKDHSLASRDLPSLIHQLVIAAQKDLRPFLSARKVRHVSSVLRWVWTYQHSHNHLQQDQAIAFIKQSELELVQWPGPGYEIDYVVKLDPSDNPRLLRTLRFFLKLFWKSHTGVQPPDRLADAKRRLAHSGRPTLTDDEKEYLRDYLGALLGPAPDICELAKRHGPGAVAEGCTQIEKWNFSSYPRHLWRRYGLEPISWNNRHSYEYGDIQCVAHPATKLVEVPKDSRGNRVISCEPVAMQYLQQGLMTYLMDRVPRVTRGCVEFVNQEVHASKIAGPEGWKYATIDLSDASDMVSRRLVWNIFPDDWRELLFQLRTPFTYDPSHPEHLIPLRAFAPMGSGLCFPIEALCFFAAIRLVTDQKCSVYGDDLVVPQRCAPDIMGALQRMGLVPNVAKTCVFSRFRETCGMDYIYDDAGFHRVDVKCFKKTLWKPTLNDLPSWQAWARMAIECNANYVSAAIRSIFLSHTRITSMHPSVYRKISVCSDFPNTWPWTYTESDQELRTPRTRWNRDLMRKEHQIFIPLKQRRVKTPDHYSGLLSSLGANLVRRPSGAHIPSERVRLKCVWWAA